MEPRSPPTSGPAYHPPSLRVLLVDDHDAVLCGLAALVRSDAPRLHLAGTARCGDEALSLAARFPVDVIALDVLLGDEDGLSLLPELVALTGAAVVVLTSNDDATTRARAFSQGATAFLAKTASGSEILAALHGAVVHLSCLDRTKRP